MYNYSEQGFQIGDLKGMLRRRARLAAVVGGAVFLLSVLVASLLPNEYRATATLLIEPQTISEKLVEPNLEESDLNNRLHLIQMQILSRGRLSRVIDDLKVYPEESKTMTREEVIEMMRDRISVVPVLPQLSAQAGIRSRTMEINTFQLSYRHKSAKMAADVANRLSNDFIEEHIRERVQSSGDTSEFIEAELTRLSTRMGEVESQIASIKTENAGQLPEDLDANQRLHERIIQSLRDAQREFDYAESDQAFYRQQMITGAADFYKYARDNTPERRLEVAKLQLNEYRSRGFTDKHPDVIATQAEIAELEQLTQNPETEDNPDLSIAQQNAKAEQQRAALKAKSAKAEIERLRGQLSQVEERLAATPRVQEQLSALEREQHHLFESYQEYSNKRLEANVAADMERRQKGEKFRLLEAAIAEPQPASPNRPVIVLAGLVLGAVLGAGLALVVEALDDSFHDARSLRERLQLPVLVSVPKVVLESDRALKRRRQLRELIAAGAVVGLVLSASVAGNWIVNGPPGVVKKLMGSSDEQPAAPAPAEQGGR